MPNDYRRYNFFNKYLGKPSITYRVKQLKNTHRTLVLKYQHTFTVAVLSDLTISCRAGALQEILAD